MTPDDDLLTTTEGVDEGSAASTAEGPGSTPGAAEPAAVATEGHVTTDASAETDPAPPADMETEESRSARSGSGTGQQLEAGEG